MPKNIFDYTLPNLDAEVFTTHLKDENVEIKTIVSNTLKTPQTFVQDCDEWVVVLQGCAKIELDAVVHKLKKGDTLFIPANKKHTLLKTRQVVVWLAVYIGKK
ncbi:MAG: cupin domain-containing protein [Epsilonproteobacteria bacterium]|nr:cupin domain-containing protein [Campylobacterota bacterium]